MICFFCLLVAGLLACTGSSSSATFTPKKALNVFLDDNAYRGLPSLSSQMPRLKQAGLDTVRLVVSPEKFMGANGNFSPQPMLEQAINAVLAAGLNIVVDSHSTNSIEFPATNKPFNDTVLCGSGMKHYENFLETLARYLNRYPKNRVALELMNEPNLGNCPQAWQPLLKRLYTAARRGSSDLMLVLSSPELSSPFALEQVNPFNDANTIYTVHYYGPLEFTHQGAWYIDNLRYLVFFAGLPYPVTAADSATFATRWASIKNEIQNAPIYTAPYGVPAKSFRSQAQRLEALQQAEPALRCYLEGNANLPSCGYPNPYGAGDIDYMVGVVQQWAKRNNIPAQRLWLGEFGVQGWEVRTDVTAGNNRTEGAAPADRNRWVQDVRQKFEAAGMGWAYFTHFGGAFSLTEDHTFPPIDPQPWDVGLTTALGLIRP